ncbi:hypothetical protein FRC15_003534 [Serendipita sp. 397]|nr:hypothetical protein FRC15_003534 [Serendipita sp. 397]
MATGQLFDHYLAQAQSRSRSDSAVSSSLSASTVSLPPPPRHNRKVTSPPPVVATSSRTSPIPSVQKPGSRNGFADPESSRPFPRTEHTMEGEPFQRPLGQPIYRGNHHMSTYSDSLSSDNSYSNLFYKPERDAGSPPLTQSAGGNRESQALSFDDEISVEDYSALLYPDLQSAPPLQPSPRPSIDIHGPPLRRRVSSFTSHNGPESPVEFAGLLSSSVPQDSEDGLPELSKIDRLLGIEPSLSSNRDKGLAFDTGRRESFMDMDLDAGFTNASTPDPSSNAALRPKPSLPDDMPTFAAIPPPPTKSLNDYVTMLGVVENRELDPETTSTKGSRQVLVDGSDKPRIATPDISRELGSTGRPSTTNLLDQKERAELVRKNRKIVQVLGPGVSPVVQAHQSHMRVGASSPNSMERVGYRRDPIHRPTQSDALAFGEHKSGSVNDARRYDEPIKSGVPHKSSWSVLDHDTIFLAANGRRHSSPMSPTLITPVNDDTRDSDVASMSSLGSIIKPDGDNGERESLSSGKRSNSPTSFIELSDDDGMKTPKRRRSVELPETKGHTQADGITRKPIPSDLPQSIRTNTSSVDEFYPSSAASEGKWGDRVNSLRTKRSLASSVSWSDDDASSIDHPWRGESKRDEWELERQRKRQQLAKIHRYLGSKVPAELVVGFSSSTERPIQSTNVTPNLQEEKKRRRSSSAAMYPSWDHPSTRPSFNRIPSDGLSSAERMQKMKSAAKIEQIFGEPPPRRLSLSLTRPSERTRDDMFLPQPHSGLHQDPETSSKGYKAQSPFVKRDGRPSTGGSSSRPSTTQSNTGLISSYNKDMEREKRNRKNVIEVEETQVIEITTSPYPIGTALGSPWEDLYDEVIDISPLPTSVHGSKAPVQPGVPTSRQFLDYRNSLNTLHRILDQDDRQSLNELHAVLDSEEEEEGHVNLDHSSLPHGNSDRHRRSPPTEREHKTLQPRISLASINTVATDSTYGTLTPKPMDFQARRKRAAKLTHFFGATYRDLFGEVLDRIERGMLEEAAMGAMSEEEVKDLMKQLDRLKRRHSQLA